MKTRLILFILLFISGFAIAGCKQQNQYRPDAKIVAAFNNKYPQSDKVEWEQKQGYYVAEFREDGIEHEAWFDGTGKWVMTESNLRYSSLPQAIRTIREKCLQYLEKRRYRQDRTGWNGSSVYHRTRKRRIGYRPVLCR